MSDGQISTLNADMIPLNAYFMQYEGMSETDALTKMSHVEVHSPNSCGIVLRFGNAVIGHWVESDVNFASETALNRIIADKLAHVLFPDSLS